MSSFHNLSIQTIYRLTDKSVSITFNLPDNLKDTFSYKAGQYITLKTNINGEEVRRDYSLCDAPTSGNLTVAVKEVENGTFSVFANNTLQAGDTLEVGTPNGRFTFEPKDNKTKNMALFAAGSGITPILGIIKCALTEEDNSKIVLVYGNKTTSDTMFLNELLELQNQYSERFSIQFVFSQQDETDAVFGRIEKSTINYVVKNKYKHIEPNAYYICGPEGMIHTVKDVLTEHGVSEDLIHFELFKASKIETEAAAPVTQGKSKITVTVDDESTTFEMDAKQTILEAALDEDLDAPYSCQGGICSSCLARVTEGEATMRQNNILTENEVAEGLILTCQAHPTSATITVDFDDV
ncbi:ferredoxin--NADP reductase [Neotamlana laminarinivorans]|uniref:Ferredoxin--NADP reductase n=1 Tax=Neotamlana laminarinivorans TaxID=2883124 RepID=A0A9X1L3A7_9FLAO|nr:ferredoxin--NADP reductase [Tamlana laminarinivorans]MCB4798344.1 ferredoxin--NADP reductase [Tamlana laminarinivorans]